jgi:Photosynthesis affected mutant 68
MVHQLLFVLLLVLYSSCGGIDGFAPPHRNSLRTSPSAVLTRLGAASKNKSKGFGSVSTDASPQGGKNDAKKGKQLPSPAAAGVAEKGMPIPTARASSAPQPGGSRPPPPQLNAGQRALEDMRRQRAEVKDAELRRVRELLEVDRQLEEAPAAIPEAVAQRMGKRMLPFVGIPLFLGMGIFVAFWYSATYLNLEYQPALVAASTIAILVFGLLVRRLSSLSIYLFIYFWFYEYVK